MTPPRVDVTPAQARTYEILQRIKMAWVALWFMMFVFTATMMAFLYALFVAHSEAIATTIIGAINGIVAWTMKIIYSHLFPAGRTSA